MIRSIYPRSTDAAIRWKLAGLSAEVSLIRLGRVLSRKYQPDQPREPAGQPGGGRWVSDEATRPPDGDDARPAEPATTGSIGGDESRSERTETTTEDGSHVLTIRIRSNPQAEWEEQHTVTAPDGASTLFENSGLTQTIRAGDTGEILGRNTLTRAGAEPEAFVQDARGPFPIPSQFVVNEALKALGALYAALSGQNGQDGTTVFAAPASEYTPNANRDLRGFWVGRVDQSTLDGACPRNGEVQAIANDAAARITLSGAYTSPQDYGNKVHRLIAGEINGRRDPKFLAETSYDLSGEKPSYYGNLGSVRLDVLEESTPTTVCVYDHKTGKAELPPARANRIAFIVQKNFPKASRIILIEVRPKQ